MNFVVNKEFTSDDKEQDDTGQDVREGLVQTVDHGNFACALLQEYQQQGGEYHGDGIELCQPGYHDAQESASSGQCGGDGVVCAGNHHPAGKSAKGTGQKQRPDDNTVNLDANVVSCLLAFADNRNLITVLTVIHVNVHANGDDSHENDYEPVAVVADVRQPAGIG